MQDRNTDARLFSEAAQRNKGPILAVLQRTLPSTGLVLEIASGSGQHIAHFAAALPALQWQPSDPDARSRASIRAWIRGEGLANVNEPVALDVRSVPWPVLRADALVCINMIHIAPWAATEALFAGAQRLLAAAAVLFLYGPYRRFDSHTAPSNAAFDAQLRATNPAWGVRDLERVVEVAAQARFELAEVVAMPANNFSVVFCNAGSP
jgi:SAM-dependent methyltransferase